VPEALEPEQRAVVRSRRDQGQARTTTQRTPSRTANVPRTAPRATPEPPPRPKPIVIMATDMRPDVGTSDTEGGWALTAAGALWLDNYRLEAPIGAMVLEAKGQPAGGVWPEVDVNFYDPVQRVNYGGWPRDFITSSEYTEFHRDTHKVIPPGEYTVIFRYHNNTPVPPGEDRNVWLRKIELYPQ
jgi:hypothetical protein